MSVLPKRFPGRPSALDNQRYEVQMREFCLLVERLRAEIGFAPSVRGWCYVLEEHGLSKGEFGDAEKIIKDCRRNGYLDLNIVCEDDARAFDGLETLENPDPKNRADEIIYWLGRQHERYTPVSFWHAQDYHIQMMVEKIDLKTLFSPICKQFHIPIANTRGWQDLHQVAAAMRQFAEYDIKGKQPVLLYCGDHDVAGLLISDKLRRAMEKLANVVGWRPDELVIDRFGLNADFINAQGLTWIEGLKTSSGKDLADEEHPHHWRRHVQNYIKKYGKRKCEANALVVRPAVARQLCLDTILKYLSEDAPGRYKRSLQQTRHELQFQIREAAARYGQTRRRLR